MKDRKDLLERFCQSISLKFIQNNDGRELLSITLTAVNSFNILTAVRKKLNCSLLSLFFNQMYPIKDTFFADILYEIHPKAIKESSLLCQSIPTNN